MEKIDLSKYQFKKARKENPRQELVNQLASELNLEHRNLRGIYFSELTDNELRKIWQEARAWKVNPAALFYKLLKKKAAEIKHEKSLLIP